MCTIVQHVMAPLPSKYAVVNKQITIYIDGPSNQGTLNQSPRPELGFWQVWNGVLGLRLLFQWFVAGQLTLKLGKLPTSISHIPGSIDQNQFRSVVHESLPWPRFQFHSISLTMVISSATSCSLQLVVFDLASWKQLIVKPEWLNH